MNKTNSKIWVQSVFSEWTDINTSSVDKPQEKRARTQPDEQKILNSRTRQTNKKPKLKAPTSVAVNSKWTDQFVPTTSGELAVHPKKLEELRNWLEHCAAIRTTQRSPICLISGPVGSGKTAALRVLAEEFQYELQEYINPIDREQITKLGDQDGSSQFGSRLDDLKTFLHKASRFNTVFSKYNKRILLVEDFPNTLLTDAPALERILEEYTENGLAPLVFIVADSKGRTLNIRYNLFPDNVKERFHITHISFNPVAATLLHKTMKRFCDLIYQRPNYKVPAQDVIDSIVFSAQGDIRNALINFHFTALTGQCGPLQTVALTNESKKNRKKEQKSLKSVGCDPAITMMHALGRVFNPKLNADERFVHNPEELADAFVTEPKKFLNFVHANYVPHFRSLEHIISAADALSLADIMLTEYRDDALALTGLNLGIRSVMVENRAPVIGWMPVCGYKRNVALQHNTDCGGGGLVSTGLFATDFSAFVKLISAKRAPALIVDNSFE